PIAKDQNPNKTRRNSSQGAPERRQEIPYSYANRRPTPPPNAISEPRARRKLTSTNAIALGPSRLDRIKARRGSEDQQTQQMHDTGQDENRTRNDQSQAQQAPHGHDMKSDPGPADMDIEPGQILNLFLLQAVPDQYQSNNPHPEPVTNPRIKVKVERRIRKKTKRRTIEIGFATTPIPRYQILTTAITERGGW
ncbi:hypothetical protein BGZ83_011404, partial [Gryganskiella cystojenkinii]